MCHVQVTTISETKSELISITSKPYIRCTVGSNRVGPAAIETDHPVWGTSNDFRELVKVAMKSKNNDPFPNFGPIGPVPP